MKIFKDYKKMTIIFAALFVVFGMIAAITYPKETPDIEGQYKEVSVVVTNVESRAVSFRRFNNKSNKKEYYLTIEYENQEYTLGPLSNPGHHSTGPATMYIYQDKFYQSVSDIKKSARISTASPICRVSMGIFFVSIILFIGYITAFLQDKKKKKKM